MAVSIADSFALEEIRTRVEISESKFLITQYEFNRAGKTINLYDKAKNIDGITNIVINVDGSNTSNILDKDIIANDWCNKLNTKFDSISCNPHDPINILFSSGTTGTPKAIPWDHTTPIKAAIDGYFNQDIQEGDIVAWPTNLGWMMGPWLVFAVLINKGTIAISQHYQLQRTFANLLKKRKLILSSRAKHCKKMER